MKELQDIDLKQIIEQETGQKFNREGYICCPFHNEKTPSMSVKFIPNANKERYHCWGCSAKGDVIDFIMKYKNMTYDEARGKLGLSVEKTERELQFDKILSRIDWDIKNTEFKQGYKFLGLFEFVNEQNEIVYYKAKFLKPNGKKASSYYHFEGDKIINNRGMDEIPYNLYNVIQGMNDGKTIIFVEGEKDANNINSLLKNKNYVATSIKGCTNLKIIQSEFMKIMVLGDTGEAGEKYVNNIKFIFLKNASSFKIINLPGLKSLGNNKDVTDWLEAGHTKKDLLNAFSRSLNLKDKFEFQQDSKGIYKLKFSKDDEEGKPVRVYITDFNLLEASKIQKVDAEVEGIRLKLKSCIDGKTIEKVGSSKIFDDLKTFRNFLGMDFSFMGANVGELVKLKGWVNKYFAIDNAEIYNGAKFIPLEDKFQLITSTGSISSGIIDYTKVSENTKIDILDIKPIEKQELQDLMQHLFKFVDYSKAISIIGSVLSFLQVGQNIEISEKLHHLLIVGESGSGKSTILEKVVAPILNYPVDEKKAMSTSPFAIQKMLSTGNYPILFDEFKPSMMDKYKSMKLSDIFRTAYDRLVVSRGDKSFNVSEFKLDRPLIISGEESYPNQEKANITRSCIVYISKHERTEQNSTSMYWLVDHEELLKKLGKSIILEVLKLPVDEYKTLRTELRGKFNLKDRPLNTAVNIACGIELLNKVLIKQGLEPVGDYHKYIEQNIREEVLDGGEDTNSVVEQMLCLYNDMIQDNSFYCNENAIKFDYGKVFIRTQLVIDAIHKYIKDYQSADLVPLKIKDFKKQAKKAGYIVKSNAKQIRINIQDGNVNSWFDEYDKKLLQKLNISAIVEPDLMEEALSIAEQNIFSAASNM